ncbi:N-acetylmuramoyl-L-alanine amidase [Haloferula luteola]|uniref:N-acetylmuramoyl-L-alanine amidase n=1 Tax=Haloferula luteola TaxID=595692 RepID=A0A840VGW5_9BACT|nr:N-acetylmuramoyl-L-alanine amidase [Haloferula luteola]MBB5352021.1 N-acetylmuramoyl-L-alanine amidase [Haloferula luteola]
MRWSLFFLPWVVLGLSQCSQVAPPPGFSDVSVPVFGSRTNAASVAQVQSGGVEGLRKSIHLKVDLVPKGTHGRKVIRPMNPRYITIHSTQNFSADAERHSLALKRGALRAPKRKGGNRIGYLIWHFTVDDRLAIQHMPTNEQGEHADFDGPGNNYSIGIEMCEQRGSNLQSTIDRTARLTAYLMHRHQIPISHVVPHYHWPRHGVSQPHKNCPHFLLDHGRPGRKWSNFQSLVMKYYNAAKTPA